ncbi:hypothetical protein D917_06009 [Trichinella nativa]|uniref:CCHC-type domain-containing protein n=1 Tax=Trichinella nativa TaxID=6335 RepID=A0A1Y3EU70_9BILA|nr:hypothetical protein D917_06009 [Trichinella nativa]
MLKARSSSPPRKLVGLKRRLQFFAEELDQLCKENVAPGRIEAQLVTAKEIYRRVDRLWEEYETGLDGEEAATAITEREVARHASIAKGSHKASACPEVLKANSIQRRALDKKAGLCFSCLEPGHEAKGCGQHGGKKNSGRSRDSPAPLSGVKPSDPSQERDQKEGKQLRPVRVNLTSGDESGGTRLQIIRARGHSDGGKKMVVNCLFDTAAERSFIREDVTQELQLKRFLLW